jgi:hypothetical protein
MQVYQHQGAEPMTAAAPAITRQPNDHNGFSVRQRFDRWEILNAAGDVVIPDIRHEHEAYVMLAVLGYKRKSRLT